MKRGTTVQRQILGLGLTGAVVVLLASGGRADDDAAPSKPAPLNMLKGRVLDHEQKPVTSAKVYAVRADEGFMFYGGPDHVHTYARDEKVLFLFTKYNGRGSGDGTTDDQGHFDIKGLHAGRFNLLAVHKDRGVVVKTEVEQPNADDGVDLVLAPPTFIEGTITGLVSKDRKLYGYFEFPGMMPWQIPWQTPFGASRSFILVRPSVDIATNGTFRVGPLPAGGPWALSFYEIITKRSFGATLLKVPVSAQTGKTTQFNLDLIKGPKLTGRIRGPQGEPLKDVAVSVTPASASGSIFSRFAALFPGGDLIVPQYGAVTDQDGNYTIAGFPAGSYSLEAKRHAPRTGFG